jgi:Fur family transcriptional regulator, peroxide stress response regulator
MHRHPDATDRLSAFEVECRHRGLALTIQRRAVYAELADRKDHPTADQVYDAVYARLPGLSRTTVYRVLDTLVEQGFARRVHHTGGVARFDPITARHHHLVCDGCGRLADLDDDAIASVRLPDPGRTGFKIRDYSISFTGLCKECR